MDDRGIYLVYLIQIYNTIRMRGAEFAVLSTMALLAMVSAKGFTGRMMMTNDIIPKTAFDCLAGKNVTYVSVSLFAGEIVSSCITNLQNARAAGMSSVDVFVDLFPAVPGNFPPSIPLTQIWQYIGQVDYSRMWIGVFSGQNVWFDDPAKNRQYLIDFVTAGREQYQFDIGIFSAADAWESIFGDQSWTDPSLQEFQLMYSSLSQDESYNDFIPFAHWTAPVRKFDTTSNPGDCGTTSAYLWHP